jgi:hypothetical protein
MKNLRKHMLTLNGYQEYVTWWWSIRHTTEGHDILLAAKRVFSDLSVSLGGGRTPYLFTTQDSTAKTAHNAEIYDHAEQIVQYMLPHRLSGEINICIWSTIGCRNTCLHKSGRLAMADIAKLARTLLFSRHPLEYIIIMLSEIESHVLRVRLCNKTLVVRPNGTGDIPWEMLGWMFDLVASLGRGTKWFDYTKGLISGDRTPRPDYYLVASATERTTPETIANYPDNVVVVVNVRRGQPLPDTFYGRPVVDGDRHDLRLFDPQGGHAVLVRAKGLAVKAPAGPREFVKAV